jgi:hypothetical protein
MISDRSADEPWWTTSPPVQPSRVVAIGAILAAVAAAPDALPVRPLDVLTPVSALPAHVVNRFSEDSAFAAARSGDYVVLDRRNHAIYLVDPAGRNVRRMLDTGWEPGRVLSAVAFTIGGDDILAVADSPNGFDRIQYFSMAGMRIGGFYLPMRKESRLTIDGVLVDAAGALAFTGLTFLVNQPEWGGLFTEFDASGVAVRQVGVPRSSGPRTDRDIQMGMNIGIPLVDPTGGFFFVFQTAVPMFRKYDREGRLLFERHIEGPEIDAHIQALPTTWEARSPGTRPVIPPLVRAAAVDRSGRLWVSLAVPYTYVFDNRGEKTRTVQFRATGPMSPSSLFFTPRGRLLIGPGGYEFEVE